MRLDAFEGPLDLLLSLARSQKLDLRRISLTLLADQYLDYLRAAQDLRLDVAADYLVMAAWLAYLKSRLLLPRPADDEGEDDAAAIAEHLAFRLARLEAMRGAARRLFARDLLGRDVFARGMPETHRSERRTQWRASLPDLLRAYARLRSRDAYAPLHVARPPLVTVEEAIARLTSALGASTGCATLQSCLPADLRRPEINRSAVASLFAAALELGKAGKAELRQDAAFGPIYLRSRPEPLP